MIRFAPLRTVGFLSLLALNACSSEPKTAADAPSGAFNYAPALDRPHRETMKRVEEVAIPGSPLRDSEEWTLEWDVVTTKDGENFKRSLKLVGLKINVNGQALLKGDEVKSDGATLVIVTDKQSNVLDVQGADGFSQAIVGLGAPDAQPALKRIFSPERLKLLAVVRSIELHEDFVGRPSAVGSTWTAKDPDGGAPRQIKVLRETPCGTNHCVEVQREYQLDRNAVYADISEHVAAYVQQQGGDPSKIEVVGMDLKLADSLVIEPSTMDYHGAKFDQEATIRLAGPAGELPVSVKVQRQTDYRY